MNLTSFINEIKSYNPAADLSLLRKSYRYAEKKHEGQTRLSGGPFFEHCKQIAQTLIALKMDVVTISAGLLHDVLEDTSTPREELEREFGAEVTNIVEGVTKINTIPFRIGVEKQAENLRKMVLAMTRDVRVILIKLADRLHNMRTLEYLPREKQVETAKETLEIYAPLAHRFGIYRLKSDLEDLCLKFLESDIYYDIARRLQSKRAEREEYAQRMTTLIRDELQKANIKAEVFGRAKHLYSIYEKVHRKGTAFEDMYDLIAFRVLVNTERDCYSVLGTIHAKWTPLPGRFKDYIALPKTNMYQSLHTTIIGLDGKPVEIQIRTHDMHKVAEYGIAAHWRYKEGIPADVESGEEFEWLRRIAEGVGDLRNPRQFMEMMRGELFPDDVYVFTPKGDVKAFPVGATPIDFAYSIHTEVGHTCVGAKINSNIVPLKYQLQSGDIVEIITDSNAKPSKDWLRIAKTSRALNKIRAWIRVEERSQSIELGEQLFEAEMKKLHLNSRRVLKSEEMLQVAQSLNFESVEDLLASIGYGKTSASHIANLIVPPPETEEKPEKPKPEISKLIEKSDMGVKIAGVDRPFIRIAKCCNPIPGDEIIGFITRGRGVSVHVADCTALPQTEERIVSVSWMPDNQITYPAEIAIQGNDRKGLLADVASAITKTGVNISGGAIKTDREMAENIFVVDVTGVEQLQKVVDAINRVKGVISVRRKKRLGVRG